jgi:hypothetical protein
VFLDVLQRGEQHVRAARGQQGAVRYLQPVRIVVVRLGRDDGAPAGLGQIPERVAPGGGGDDLAVGEQEVEA